MAESKARFLANLIGADNTANDFTLPNTAVSGTNNKVLTSGGDGTVTWEATEIAPTTTSISPNEVASSAGGNITITLTGTNYATSGMTVTFLANSGSDITSGITVTHGTGTSFTVTVARSSFVDANEPYSIKVTKSSGLTHTLADALRVDNAPSFSTYVGALSGSPPVVATVEDNETSSQITARNIAISAVDVEGDTVTYSETTSTLTNAGMTLSSAGAITGTPTAVSSDTNYDFTARATSTGDGGGTTKTTDQNFRFTITNYIPQLFAGKIYDGTNNALYVQFNESKAFPPDLVWVKNREQTQHHTIFDTVRGATKRLIPNLNSAEDTQNQYLTDFEANGFDVGSPNNAMNASGIGNIAWAWIAGGEPSGGALPTIGDGTGGTVIKGAGTIPDSSATNNTSIVQSVNRETGLSITKFNGDGGGGFFPHNLGATPDVVIVKKMTDDNDNQNWAVWHTSLSATKGKSLFLNTNGSEGSASGYFDYNNTAHSSTNISVGSNDVQGGSDDDYICYAWKSVSNLSSFGSFQGNAGTKNLVLGFHPRLIILKRVDSTGNWHMYDTFRSNRFTTTGATDGTGCSMQPPLFANETQKDQAYSTTGNGINEDYFGSGDSDAVTWYTSGSDKGVRIDTNNGEINGNNEKILYMAWA